MHSNSHICRYSIKFLRDILFGNILPNISANIHVIQVYVCGVCPSQDNSKDAIFHYYGNSMVVDPWWVYKVV